MTQHELARAVGMPQPSVARIERGTVIPRTATLTALLAATGHRITVEPIGPEADREAIRRRLAMSVPQRTRQAIGRMARNPRTSPVRMLRRLRRFGVPFVLTGDLAEVVHGSPTTLGRVTEVCHASSDVARDRLALALDDLGARPSDGFEHETDAGRLRLSTETAAGDTYDVLVRNAVSLPVDAGIVVRVGALEDLIRVRRARCSPEDQEAEAVLCAVEEEQDRADFSHP
jgi:transcriptional regulator with XRE-family HTH domain